MRDDTLDAAQPEPRPVRTVGLRIVLEVHVEVIGPEAVPLLPAPPAERAAEDPG